MVNDLAHVRGFLIYELAFLFMLQFDVNFVVVFVAASCCVGCVCVKDELWDGRWKNRKLRRL